MKTALKAMPKIFLLFLTLALLYTSCEEKAKQDPDQEEENDNPPIVERPDNIITLKEAKVIFDNYTQHRVSLIEPYERETRAPEEKFEASRFVDFDYNTIKQYIDYVDQEAAKAGVKEVTKLRLYFANYPKEKKFPNDKEVIHPRQNSIFMLPTLEQDGVNYGFYIGPDGKAKRIADWKAEMMKGMGLSEDKAQKAYAGFSMNSNLVPDGSLTLNYGHGGPPPIQDF